MIVAGLQGYGAMVTFGAVSDAINGGAKLNAPEHQGIWNPDRQVREIDRLITKTLYTADQDKIRQNGEFVIPVSPSVTDEFGNQEHAKANGVVR